MKALISSTGIQNTHIHDTHTCVLALANHIQSICCILPALPTSQNMSPPHICLTILVIFVASLTPCGSSTCRVVEKKKGPDDLEASAIFQDIRSMCAMQCCSGCRRLMWATLYPLREQTVLYPPPVRGYTRVPLPASTHTTRVRFDYLFICCSCRTCFTLVTH